MAEESKQPFDPDATVKQPVVGPDPEATFTGPVVKAEPDPEATASGLQFDPEATLNPAARAAIDPEATVRIPAAGKRRRNPFAPQASRETLLANLSALGGLNPLVAIANPILGAVPQIRHALKHRDPKRLRASLRNQIEAFEANASAAGIPGEAVKAAVTALCFLLDESAASTPWGSDWIEHGLLHELRREKSGGAGFFALLERITADPGANPDLIEFFYVCLALGFEGHPELRQAREKLYAIVSRRRPRPADGLSERWRSTASPAAAPAASPTTAKIPVYAPAPVPARVPGLRLRLRRSWPGVAAAVVAALFVGYLLSMRLMQDEAKTDSAKPKGQEEAAVPVPAVPPSPPQGFKLSKLLEQEALTVAEDAGRVTISLRDESQFGSGNAGIKDGLKPLVRRIAQALDRVPGAILVTGHTDAVPMRSRRFASNQELAAARAQSVARLLAAGLGDPRRVQAEGRADSEPLAPGDSEAERARNRRVVIALRPGS